MQVLEQCREQLPVAFHVITPVGDALAFLLWHSFQISQPKGEPTHVCTKYELMKLSNLTSKVYLIDYLLV